MANKNRKNTYQKKKSLGLRIFIAVLAAALILGIIIMPLAARAEGNDENLTVPSFETGKLSEAILEAADGTDYNFIKNIAVMSGKLSSGDYAALLQIPNLEIIELAGTETEDGVIPENALPSRNQLTLISLPKNTEKIGAGAFANNRKLTKILMPASVKYVGDEAFSGCEALESFPVSAKIEYIGAAAFRDCKSITEFAVPAGITEIYADTFSKCGFESFSIGPDVTKIGSGVFADCNNLKDIYAYGESAPALDGDVFRNVSASVHVFDGSEDSYKSWAVNNMKVVPDLTGEYLPAADTPDGAETYTEAETQTQAEIEAVTQSESAAETTAAAVEASAQNNGGGVSVGAVIVIAVMAAVIAVLATLLVVSKKNKS